MKQGGEENHFISSFGMKKDEEKKKGSAALGSRNGLTSLHIKGGKKGKRKVHQSREAHWGLPVFFPFRKKGGKRVSWSTLLSTEGKGGGKCMGRGLHSYFSFAQKKKRTPVTRREKGKWSPFIHSYHFLCQGGRRDIATTLFLV